jgi:penicillin-binding protein 1A
VIVMLRFVKRASSLGLVLVAVAAVMAAAVLTVVPQMADIARAHESDAVDLELTDLAQRSAMTAGDGTFLTYLVERENREPVSLDRIPQPVIDAVLAMEDSAFYSHNGVNYRAIFRALVTNINAGGIEQGGSTITQQLVKNAILGPQQNLDRKSTEAFYALRLERQLTKDEILERYLNTVYFGSGAYGVQAAAETYWGYEDVGQLGWKEAAMLAGLIRNPTRYDPTLNAVAARDRRQVVVGVLAADGLITPEEADSINMSSLPAERRQPFDIKPTDYFIEEALSELFNNPQIPLGSTEAERRNAIYFGGLTIRTTFDLQAQADAEAARDEMLPDDPRGFEIALVSIDTYTAAVRAMVGGADFRREAFNLTTDGIGRQAGSAMKTFVLAALFEAGYTPSDLVRGDSPCTFDNPGGIPDPYEVKGGSGDRQTVAAATRASNNCAFVRLGQAVGNEAVVEVSQRLGISSPLPPVLSLPLGALEIKPLEMTAAYAAMGNGGIYNRPYYIESILDVNGEVIYQHRPDGRRALSVESARMITEVLESNVHSGTGGLARLDGGHESAGKTGTTQNWEDAWFAGYTDCLATTVWMGHPDEKVRMSNVPGWGNMFGGKVPAATWGMFNNAVHSRMAEPCQFAAPEPYGGGRYLKAPGEVDFCNEAMSGSSTRNTVLVDKDGDGKPDCFEVVIPTTTTAPSPPSESTVPAGSPAPTVPAPSGPGNQTSPPATGG